MENKTIPIYEYLLEDDSDGLFTISLVSEPAILVDFLKFSKEQKVVEQFKTINEEKRLVTGAAMIPGMRIYRSDPDMGEYYGYFSADTIKKMVYNYFKTDKINSFNIEHNADSAIKDKGVYMVESWFTTENDKSKAMGFDLPVDTWMVTLKIEDENIWNSYIKTGEVNGFSVEVAADAIRRFSNEPCFVTKQMVQVSRMKKVLMENDLQTFISQNNITELNVEYWNRQCRCSNCVELKSLGHCLEGILPNYPDHKKTIKIS